MGKKLILVVEDNIIDRTTLHGILAQDYEVLEAENGKEALEILREYQDKVALILLDIRMPVMDGYTFLSHMKEESSLAAIPVIVTTGNNSESDEIEALACGATDYVAKPYRPQVILHRVANIIKLRETAAMMNQIKYDRLTGLYCKDYFCYKVETMLSLYPDREYDIICFDIENFKLINDMFGVATGDRLLQKVADMCVKLAGEEGICGHFNADRFACLLERRFVYREMFVQAEKHFGLLPNMKSVVFKWGIYAVEERDIPVEQMCDRAFLAVNSIKGRYEKHVAYYDAKLRNRLLREQAITDSMERALAEEQFTILLQPKYTVEGAVLAGAEALVRWNHPEWGMLSPAEFIPLFEKNGFITKMDKFVWEKTCSVLSDWVRQGYKVPPVSVNVSRADIYQTDLENVLLKLTQKYEIPAEMLHLEITESAYTEDSRQIIDVAGKLKEAGFIIEMDDFGTGYSSLNMLNQMPLDILKLDMSFVQSETEKPVNKGILCFVMELAQRMQLRVVAEGVETKEQWERLREIGCDYVQGYYFAKPMPCEAFETLMSR